MSAMNVNCAEGDNKFHGNVENPSSLWNIIEERVPPSERNEIRKILGASLVDLSLDLHAEVSTLMEIWQGMRATRLTVSQLQASRAALPESPAIKDLLRQEIQFLLLDVQKRAQKEGRDKNDALAPYNPDVVSFAMGQNKVQNTMNNPANTVNLIDQQVGLRTFETSNRNENGSLSGLSNSNYKDNINAIKGKINVRNIDEVVAHLQSILQEECNTLEKHIQFLQECIEEEHNCSLNSMMQSTIPSIAELKDERKILERDLQQAPSIQSLLQVHKPPGCRSSKRSCRNISRWSNTAANTSEETQYSILAADLSEADLEQKIKKHSISTKGESSSNGTGNLKTLAASSHRTSFRAVDLSLPSYHDERASASCPTSENTCAPHPLSNMKGQNKVQLHLMGDVSGPFDKREIESTHDRTCIEGSLLLQAGVQKSLAYSESPNNFAVWQQSVSSSIRTDSHYTTESKRTSSSNLRNSVEVLSSIPKQDGRVLIPSPPSGEKPTGAQPRNMHRVRRARVDSLAGSA
ncbi:coiled-coil domain-containing protein 24 isoform X1 [Chiloscyllium plagiosum]|uniref:coiled-coil domain-containing protein 24 isoform X1 n=3 Tax=Chiloscyllium plagiosum TaxID=36176 RepID=UPI001CB7DFBB|nr:coiled-coil domain-containing protein 24 isoform X1 [Chiloscyllium plagiosum]